MIDRPRMRPRAAAAFAALAVLGTVAAGCGRGTVAPPPDAPEAVLAVDGMTCASCAVTVRTAATRVDGVYDARVDVDRGRARVHYDPTRTTPQAIAEAISRAGYPARPAGP